MSELKMLGDRLEREWIYQLEDKLVYVSELDEKVIRHSDFLEVCEFITRLYKQERRRKFKPLPKQSKKQTIRSYENGIKVHADFSEECMTKAARVTRAEEVGVRDGGVCQFPQAQSPTGICGVPVLIAWANLHHRRKRSVGRDDRAANLLLMCQHHHIFVEHDEFKKRGVGQ